MGERPESDDKRFVGRLLGGDEEAFEEFFGVYFPRLYRFALARLRDADAAEEVVQATLVKAIHKLGTYRGEAALFTWLCTFCRYEMSALWRRSERSSQRVELTEDNPEIRAALESLPAAAREEPEARAYRQEVARLVQVTLDHLPRHYGDALEWKYVDGLSVKEIAELLGVGPKAAESLLTRARRAFRNDFGPLTEGMAGLLGRP